MHGSALCGSHSASLHCAVTTCAWLTRSSINIYNFSLLGWFSWVVSLSTWEDRNPIKQPSRHKCVTSNSLSVPTCVTSLHIMQCLTFLIAATGLTHPLQGRQARAQSTTRQPTSGAVQWQPTKLQRLGAPTPPTPTLPPPPHPINLQPRHPHNLLGTSNISSSNHSSNQSSSKVILQQQSYQ